MNKRHEIRWFQKGLVPPVIKNWFERKQYNREYVDDIYLVTHLCSGIGIKIRNGKTEIKKQIAEKVEINVKGLAGGNMAVWHKYSFNLMPDQLAGLRSADDWLTIHKIRKISYSRFADNPSFEQFRPYGEGCRTELAQIKILKEDWWTVIFEFFGDQRVPANVFSQAASVFLAGFEPGILTVTNSHSYPEFIAALKLT